MCGRYALARPASDLVRLFDAVEGPGLLESYQPSFNIGPTRHVAGLVTAASGARLLEAYRWGLVPSGAVELSTGNRLFNARAETLEERPVFAGLLERRRVAVVADGFYEWTPGPGDRRPRPYYFRRPDGEPLFFAGLWDAWHPPARSADVASGPLLSCTIITTAAGEDMAGIHDRMPAILPPDCLEGWLQPRPLSRLDRESLLRPAPAGTLVHHPVDPRVGDVREDDAGLVARFAAPPEPEPLTLFG